MILGIGTDIVDINRFKTILEKAPKILERVYTEKELKKAKKLSGNKRVAYFAKRFAAKEAFSKTCGTGIGTDIGWKDIEISNDKKGAPVITLTKKAETFLKKKFKSKDIHIFLSLTDEKEYAMAFTLLTK